MHFVGLFLSSLLKMHGPKKTKKHVNNSVVTLRSISKSANGGSACTRNAVCVLIILIIRI